MATHSKNQRTSIQDLEADVAQLERESSTAREQSGEYSRPYREAADLLRTAQRKLASAQERAAHDAELAALTPREIVDRAMGR